MQTLPAELTDRIIDYIGQDKPAVKTYGLVCRQWYPRSRFLLFSEAKLRVERGSISEDPDNIESFLELVSTSSFDILAAITHLTFRYGKSDSPAKAHLLRFVQCSRLTNLTFELPDIRPSERAPIYASFHSQLAVVGPNFPSLSTFSFAFKQWTLRGLLDILACLPMVENLFLNGDVDGTEISSPVPLFPPRLRSLDIALFSGAFENMLSLPIIPLLRSLSLNLNRPKGPIAVYLQRTAHTLESLSFTIMGEPLYSLPVS
jgi:hypothetical protein